MRPRKSSTSEASPNSYSTSTCASLNVTIELSLMFSPCFATVYWARVAISGGIALLIGRWFWGDLRHYFLTCSCFRSSLASFHRTTFLCLRPHTRPHESTSPPRTPVPKRVDSMDADSASPENTRRPAIEPLNVEIRSMAVGPAVRVGQTFSLTQTGHRQ